MPLLLRSRTKLAALKYLNYLKENSRPDLTEGRMYGEIVAEYLVGKGFMSEEEFDRDFNPEKWKRRKYYEDKFKHS